MKTYKNLYEKIISEENLKRHFSRQQRENETEKTYSTYLTM